ncbi:MAG: hypothetical protein ACOZB3_13200 [Calditrichota bacterium]
MKNYLQASSFIATLLCLSLTLSGCTIAGVIAGAETDRAARKKAEGPAARILNAKPGIVVTAELTDSSRVTGAFRGFQRTIAEDYESRYYSTQTMLKMDYGLALPSVNDSLSVVMQSGDTLQAQFAGFGLYSMWFISSEPDSLFHIPLYDIYSIRTAKDSITDMRTLRQMVTDNQIPAVTDIHLQLCEKDTFICTDRIEKLRLHVKPNYWLRGLLLGLAADAATVGAAIGILFLTLSGVSPGPIG